MININKNSKIYVLAPEGYETGGTELAHQLVDFLISKGSDAYIVYCNHARFVTAEVPPGFRKYNINVAPEPTDSSDNILVLPEINFNFSNTFQNIQFVFWWMSIDNFYRRTPLFEVFGFFSFMDSVKIIYNRYKVKENVFEGYSFRKLKAIKSNHFHAYQSTYAKYHLLRKGVKELLPLSDYINSELIQKGSESVAESQKENIILYNPAKGLKFTQKIIKAMPDYKFVALKGLNRDQLSDYFRVAKLYIDFGNHPGKDRLPREAAINGCCIIVGKSGSAQYFEDIPIPNHYKLDKDLNFIVKSIEYIVQNYDKANKDFEFYRKRILAEKSKFYSEIEEIFI